MSETKHTPGKLRVADYETVGSDARPILCDRKEWPAFVSVCIPSHKRPTKAMKARRDADAARLVLCWNTHDELLAKLRAIIDQEQHDGDAETHMHDMADLARAAIASATKA